MEAVQIIEQIQGDHKNKLILTGFAALQYPAVLTHQITFFNPGGGKKDYHVASYHVLIRRAPRKKIETKDHLLFMARHIELYAKEIPLLLPILQEVSLKDLEGNDRAWRLFAYLKNQILQEPIPPQKSIGRRYIDLGDIQSPLTLNDKVLHVRDALLIPNYFRKNIWVPKISEMPDRREEVERMLEKSRDYFAAQKLRPLFHRFSRYANRLESAASARIEGYEARVEVESLKDRLQKRMKTNTALRANLNMDNLHRDLFNLSREPLSLDLLLTIQKAIVKDTWRDESEKIDKTPGQLRDFDEVIVDRGKVGDDHVVYIAPHHQEVQALLEELIDYYHHSRADLYPLDLAALFKCQLTVIHPFGDGNGRLARWCFLYILAREKFIESAHQAPISHIFFQEKDRYYAELLKVDRPIMKVATHSSDPETHRYQAHYPSSDIYRNLDYSSWLAYIYDAFCRALAFSMEEHRIFEKVQSIYTSFERRLSKDLTPDQQHAVNRSIDIGLKKEWGKKTEKRLMNNGFDSSQVQMLRELVKEGPPGRLS